MINFSIHSHPIPISRSNPLYNELDDQCFPYNPHSREAQISKALALLEKARSRVSNQSQKPIKSPKSERKLDVSSLNRADISEIKSYNYLLSLRNQTQLRSIFKKAQLYPQRYNDPHYLNQSQILILSPDWSSADRYSCCSIRSAVNPSGACRLHRFCPYCSYLFGRDAQLQYVPSFNLGNWFFLTGSYKGNLGMRISSDCFNWLKYWDAYKFGLDQLLKDKSIRGYYLIEELAVTKLIEVQVLPHIHAIVDAEDLGDERIEELSQHVETALIANSAQILEPSIDVQAIESQTSLMDRLRYMFKPINLVKAYESDWFNNCSRDRKLAWELNSHTTEVVVGYSHINRRRNKMCGKGTLNSKSSQYIGISRKEFNKYKGELAALRRCSRSQYIEVPEVEDCIDLN